MLGLHHSSPKPGTTSSTSQTAASRGTPTRKFLLAARDEKRVLVSADTDFGELLAKQGLAQPSLVLFRQGNRGPEHQAATLLDNLDYVAEDLAAGAIVVFTDDNIRIRNLPMG